MSKDLFSDAFDLGYKARKQGRQLNTNPYDPESESQHYEDFQDGFAQATAEADAHTSSSWD